MDPKTKLLLKELIEEYFKGNSKGVRFFVNNSRMKLMSTTIKKFTSKPSRITF